MEITILSEGEDSTWHLVFEIEETVVPSIGGGLHSSLEAVRVNYVTDDEGNTVNLTDRELVKLFARFKYAAEEAALRKV